MTIGADGWFRLCEQLRAGHSSILLDLDLPLSAAPTAFDLDVNMADSPYIFTPSAGQKRSRDDNDDLDIDVYEYEARLEKVSSRCFGILVKGSALISCIESTPGLRP